MVELYNDYVVSVDSYNYILQKRMIVQKGKTAGQETFKNVGYFSTFGGAINCFHQELLRDQLMKEDYKSLEEAVRVCHEVNERFGDWLKDNSMLINA